MKTWASEGEELPPEDDLWNLMAALAETSLELSDRELWSEALTRPDDRVGRVRQCLKKAWEQHNKREQADSPIQKLRSHVVARRGDG